MNDKRPYTKRSSRWYEQSSTNDKMIRKMNQVALNAPITQHMKRILDALTPITRRDGDETFDICFFCGGENGNCSDDCEYKKLLTEIKELEQS